MIKIRIVNLNKCEPGAELGGTIYNGIGEPVFVRGIKLTKEMIKLLKNNGISHVYVNDKISDGIEYTEFIPREMRIEAISKIQSNFNNIITSVDNMNRITEKNVRDLEGVFEKLYESILCNPKAYNFLTTIQTKDNHLYIHSMNVSIYSIKLALALGYSMDNTKILGLGALLHDIGKMLIPRSILYKKKALTDREFEIIKSHSTLGFELLKDTMTIPDDAVQCAYQHHERLDGRGYPRGLKGDEIHPFAKIISVSDVFDAVTSNRVYQKAVLPHKGLEVLEKSSPQQLDPILVEAFPKTIAIYPPGLTVKLNTGQEGIIQNYNAEYPDRPSIRVVSDENGGILKEPFEVNLVECPQYKITQIEIS